MFFFFFSVIIFLAVLGLFAAHGLLLVGVRQGYSLVGAQTSYCLASLCRAQALGYTGFSICGTQA